MANLPSDGGAMTADGTRALRGALVHAGFAWLPEITGRKFIPKPYADWRQRETPFNPDQDYANQYGLLLNTALILDGLIAIDFDIDVPEDVDLAWQVMEDHLGAARCRRTRAGSPRTAALYACNEATGLEASRKGLEGAVEVFAGKLRKLSAFGFHTNKVTHLRTRMQWREVPGNVTRAALPVVSYAQVRAFLRAMDDVLEDSRYREITPGSHAGGAGDPLRMADDIAAVCRAAAWVPNEGPCDWQSWNRIGMALFAATGGAAAGLDAFVTWSAKNPSSAHRDCITRWQAIANSPPSNIGAGTIFHFALAAGYRRSPAEQRKAQEKRVIQQRMANWKPRI